MPARSPTRRSDTRARRRGRQATTGRRRRQVPRRSRSGDEEPRAIGVWSRCRVRERVRLAPARGRERDGDRVPDKDDRCPDEPGTAENQGCPRRTALIVIRRDRIELKQQIHFQPNRAKILSDSFDVLREVAQAIKDAPVAVRIEGHTDNVGKRKENITLSQARADAVKEYLVQEGVESKQLKSVGFGPKRPIAPNATKAGRTLNRRVEFRIEDRS